MIQDLKDKYLKTQNEITRRLNIIERHERVVNKLNSKWWGDEFIKPIMGLIKTKYPDISWDDKRLIAMGLRNNVSVFGRTKEGKLIHLCFTPKGLENGYISYDKILNYRDNHGFSHISEEIKDIQQLYDYIDAKLTT